MNGPAKAEAVGQFIAKADLHPQAVNYLETTPAPIGVACSGGVDSVAALLLVYHHFQRIRPRLHVLHFNHRLRGGESDADEVFTRDLAASLGLDYFHSSWRRAASDTSVSEARAREARHAFYDAFLEKHPGSVLVTGHQQDDILESLMLKIARAGNLQGLAAPRPMQTFADGKVMVRPLLSVRKASLRRALSQCRMPWREDRGNRENHFDRNRLRNTVIPAWEKATQFDLCQAAGRVRAYLEEADEVLDSYLKLADFPDPDANPANLPAALSPGGATRRWLHRWLAAQGAGNALKPLVVDEMLSAIKNGEAGQWSAADGWVCIREGKIRFRSGKSGDRIAFYALTLGVGAEVELPPGGKLAAIQLPAASNLLHDLRDGKYSENFTALIDSENLPERTFRVRSWRPGDRYRALNAPGHRKLQDMFVDRKISRTERKVLPVVLSFDSHIIWCPGLPIAHSYRVTQTTKEILQLTYTR